MCKISFNHFPPRIHAHEKSILAFVKTRFVGLFYIVQYKATIAVNVICVLGKCYQPTSRCDKIIFLWVWPSISSTLFSTVNGKRMSKAPFYKVKTNRGLFCRKYFNSSTMRSPEIKF
jgi:hypothetical protein